MVLDFKRFEHVQKDFHFGNQQDNSFVEAYEALTRHKCPTFALLTHRQHEHLTET